MNEYIRDKKMIQTNVQIYLCQKFDMNECPNKYWYTIHGKFYEYSNTYI